MCDSETVRNLEDGTVAVSIRQDASEYPKRPKPEDFDPVLEQLYPYGSFKPLPQQETVLFEKRSSDPSRRKKAPSIPDSSRQVRRSRDELSAKYGVEKTAGW